ncbi:papain family cysteine protease [Skeletonema marinoi]|uniref:Papain family cysteine protease n=1 Tax=Skeletonema marinoi TaxID=267567 RepID=A0AAD8Y730_9STRA|nr:papain family cysteine protease [Skeletonema marinoi]
MPHPHETPFTYDNSLVASCATSPLTRSLILSRQEGVHDGIFSPSQYENPLHHHHGNTSDCLTLLQQHASHYHRPDLSSTERRFWNLWADVNKDVSETNDTMIDMSTRHEAFLHNIMFIHQHNNDETMNHKVALNRFSDVPLTDFPQVSQQQQRPLDEEQHDSTQHPLMVNFDDPMFLHLNDDEVVMEVGSKIQRRQKEHPTSFVGSMLQTIKESWWWIGGGQLSSKHSSSSSHSKRQKKAKRDDKKKSGDSFLIDKQNELGGLESNQNVNDGDGDIDDPYKIYLNWATTDNPDGVAVVHPPVDQGICGSCWAISALGTMESSVARNMAYIGYETAYNEAVKTTSAKRHLGDQEVVESDATAKEVDAGLEDSLTLAVLAAQQVERKSIDMADLSVQELLDCDTRYDQGCAGGNPLLAFYFLHKYGVTSTKNYPYVGTQNTCNLYKVDQPIATVETWGILTEDHENNLEKVVRYIGPVAVGLGAYDPAFLSYSGGVFTSIEGSRCNHLVADHAMLIVGYGEEEAKDGTKLKYWICRNSWGAGWGEQGYVKMARIGGKKGERGICGISRSPSVALGGMFTRNAILDLDENDLKSAYFGKRHAAGEEDNESTIAKASEQIRSIIHQIRIRLGLMQKGIMMSTLSGNEKNESNRVVLFSIGMGLIMVGILISYTLHRRSRRSDRRQRRSLQRARTEIHSQLQHAS